MRTGLVICLVLAGCGHDATVPAPDASPDVLMPDAGPPSAVDLLFVIEDSGTSTEQQNIAQNFPVLVNALRSAPSGAPDLHLAVTTSNMGAGAFTSSVPGCQSPDMGRFVATPRSPWDPTACMINHLTSGATFFVDGATRNYSGDLATAFGCIAQVGANGCGFEHHLAAMRAALGDPQQGIAPPPGNEGFLRASARLAIVILAAEDDCSAPPNSLLFDTTQNSVSDPLGPLASFRCSEFGITCDGLTANNGRLPRTAAGPLQNCRSNDAYATLDPQHSLLPAQFFIDYLSRIKADVVLAVIGAPTEPFSVLIDQQTGFPALAHSCSSSNGSYGDPAVRIKQLVTSLGDRGLFPSECQNSNADAFARIATLILSP